MPDSERLTLSTSPAWSAIERLRWTTPDAAHARERDRHRRLRDRVHGGRDDGDPQLDRPREAGRRGHVVRQDVRLGRDEQDVVERQALPRELLLERQQPLDPAELEIRVHLVRQVRMNGSSAMRW